MKTPVKKKRKKAKRPHTMLRWTDEHEAELMDMYKANFTEQEMADTLGRTKMAVVLKLRRLR